MTSSAPPPAWLHSHPAGCELDVQVVPNARRTQLDGVTEGVLRVRLAAPPVDGKANAALIDFLAISCAVRRRDVEITRGLTARRKRVRIDAPIGAVWAHLSALLERSD
jgi:uncharacterized protein (TIGR00251 family)